MQCVNYWTKSFEKQNSNFLKHLLDVKHSLGNNYELKYFIIVALEKVLNDETSCVKINCRNKIKKFIYV